MDNYSGGQISARARDVFNFLEAGAIRKVIYPLWTARDHPSYAKARSLCESQQHYSADALRESQTRLLHKQLLHAYENVPYYTNMFNELQITPAQITCLEDLASLPVLRKQDLQEKGEQLLARNILPKQRLENRTGGSTGSPIQFWVDKAHFDLRRASTDRHNAWAGIRPGDFCAQLWGAVIDTGKTAPVDVPWRQRLLHRQIALNTASVTEKSLWEFVGLLRKYRPRHLIAYAQSAVMFSDFCRTNRIRDLHFHSIVTTAEVLYDHQRGGIEETFGGKVFNRYGCRELSVIASECKYHLGMHTNADNLLVEIEPDSGFLPGTGRLLITDLRNRSMPLIRYEIGDIGSWMDDGPCPCGRHLPRLARIEGRSTDFLQLPNGTRISGPALTLVHSDMKDIRQIQYEQSSPNRITINVVPGQGFSVATHIELLRRLKPYLQESVVSDVHLLDSIAKEPSGKYRFVKNTLPTLDGSTTASVSQ